MKRLILIRHAQSEHHIRDLTGGWTDTPLSAFGNTQAEALAARCKTFFAGESDLALYCSDLLRASQTAGYVAAALGIECRMDAGLREHNNGTAAGLTRAEAEKIECPRSEPALDWVPYPGAESWRMMLDRVSAAMDHIDGLAPSTAVVVTHGGSGLAVIQWWLRLSPQCSQGLSFQLDPASISEMGFNWEQERTLIRLNDTAHLS